MKKVLLTAIFLTALCGASLAQLRNNFRNQNGQNGGQGEKLEAVKIGYITQKLNLSPEEAQRFFPVYNQYAAEIKAVNQDQRQNNNLSELEREDKILSIRKKYDIEFRKVISADKVNTFFSLEKDFRDMIKKELQERRMMKQRLRGN
jgi:hypothetical protein